MYDSPKLNNLPGVEKDLNRLIEVFRYTCHYDVHSTYDPINPHTTNRLTKPQLEQFLYQNFKHLSQNKDRYDGLILILAGHGTGNKQGNDGFITSDYTMSKKGIFNKNRNRNHIFSETKMSYIKEIFTVTKNNDLEYVRNFKTKPKIFIKLACRGNESFDTKKRLIENNQLLIKKGSKLLNKKHLNQKGQQTQKSRNTGPANSNPLIQEPVSNKNVESEIFNIWSNTSNKVVDDMGFLSRWLVKNLNSENKRFDNLNKIMQSITDKVYQDSQGQEVCQTDSTLTKPIYFQRKTDDPSMFNFFITGIYDKIKHMQENIKKTLSLNQDLYINTHTKILGNEKSISLEKEMDKFLDEKDQQVCIIQGSSGAGKSMFMTKIYQDKLKNYKLGDPLPIFINLGKYKEALKNSTLLETYLKDQGLNDDNIRILNTKHDFLLILDGYDETGLRIPIYHNNNLAKWATKTVISVRDEYDANISDLVPYERNRPIFNKHIEYHITPFDKDQIESYLKKFSQQQSSKWKDWTTYKRYIETSDDIQRLVETPFMLYMICNILPKIVSQDEKEIELQGLSITKLRVFDEFSNQYFDNNNYRLQIRNEPKIDIEEYKGYAGRLAVEMLRDKMDNLVKYHPPIRSQFLRKSKQKATKPRDKKWDIFFDPSDKGLTNIRQGIPLRNLGKNTWGFIHRSLMEYFGCIHLVDSILNDDINNLINTNEKQDDIYEKLYEDIPLVFNEFLQMLKTSNEIQQRLKDKVWLTPLVNRDINISKILPDQMPTKKLSPFTMNTILLNEEPAIVKLLAQVVDKNDQIKQNLWNYIEYSKKDSKISTSAANAMTILNTAGLSFSGKDLRDIHVSTFIDNRWQGPNISGGFFGGTNFSKADLRGSVMFGSWFQKASFRNAKLDMTDMGIAKKTFKGHSDDVNSVSFSNDGKFIASGSKDKTVKIWDFSTEKLLKEFKGHSDSVSSVSFSNDGKFIASGSDDHTVKIWDFSTGKLLKEFKGHSSRVNSVSFSNDGKFIASGSRDKTVKIWDFSTGKLLKEFKGHSSSVESVSFSNDGKYIASGSWDKTVKTWDFSTGKLLKEFKGHSSDVSSVSFSNDGKFIASGSYDNTVKIWDFSTGKLLKEFNGHSSRVFSVSFSNDGKFIASGSQNKTVKIWDFSTGKFLKEFKGHSYGVTSVSFSNDGKFIASGSEDSTVKIWEFSTENLLKEFKGHSSYVESVSFSNDGKFIASGSYDETVKIWDFSTGKLLKEFKGHSSDVSSVSFSNDGKYIASGSEDNTVKIWEFSTGKLLKEFKDHSESVTSVSFSNDGKFIASGSEDNTVKIWEFSTGKLLKEFNGPYLPVHSVSFSNDGKFIASGGDDETVKIWDFSTGKLLKEFKGHSESVTSVSFSNDGKFIASGSSDETVKIWDFSTGKLLKEFKGHSSYVMSVSFSNDGKFIALGSDDSTVKIWEFSTGKLLKEFKGHSFYVKSVSFSNDGKFIASGSYDKTVKMWRVEDGIMVWSQGPGPDQNLMEADFSGATGIEGCIEEMKAVGAIIQ